MMASSSGPLPTVVPRDRACRCSPFALLVGGCWNAPAASILGLALGDLKDVSCFSGFGHPSWLFATGRLTAEDLRLAEASGER